MTGFAAANALMAAAAARANLLANGSFEDTARFVVPRRTNVDDDVDHRRRPQPSQPVDRARCSGRQPGPIA